MVTAALLLVGCGTKIPVGASEPGKMSPDEAKKIVDATLRRFHWNAPPTEFRRGEIVFRAHDPRGKGFVPVRIPLDGQIVSFRCAPLDGCDAWVRAKWPEGVPNQGAWLLHTRNDPAEMQRVVDAFNELVARNVFADRLDRDFPAKAEAWRAANPKPPLSEAGNKHRILAESAFREKDVERAIEHFEAALESDPTWPEGNFNVALLLGEAGAYRHAARYMKRYLLLVPDGKDAKAANEKIVIWEDKANRANP